MRLLLDNNIIFAIDLRCFFRLSSDECNIMSSDWQWGRLIKRDLELGESINIRCAGGCLNITAALYACVADSWKRNPEHDKLLSSLCNGRSECYAEACDGFWGTRLNCASFDKAFLWIHYRLNMNIFSIYSLNASLLGVEDKSLL